MYTIDYYFEKIFGYEMYETIKKKEYCSLYMQNMLQEIVLPNWRAKLNETDLLSLLKEKYL